MKNAKHVSWLDAARGLALLLVIIGHALTEDARAASPAAEYLYRMIYRFHMPLWFLLSGLGYGIHRERYMHAGLGYIAARFRRLMVPFFLYGAAVYGVFFLAARVPCLTPFLTVSVRSVVSVGDYAVQSLLGENPYAYHLWFLEALFLFSALAHIICLTAKDRAAGTLAALAALTVCWRLFDDNRPGANAPWIVYAVMRDLPWYLLGILLPGRITRLPHAARPIKLLTFLMSAAFMTARILCFPPLMAWPVPRILLQAVEYAAAGGLILSVLWLSQAVRRLGRPYRALRCIGEHSFRIYLLHQPLCGAVGLVLLRLMRWPIPLSVGLCALLGLALPLTAGAALKAVWPFSAKEEGV